MAEIKRVDIYMGIVGQAYVDKETALANLNAAIKNVHDMEEIIASAQEQQPIAQTVLEKAIAAQQLANTAYQQLSDKFDDHTEDDTLYVQLAKILEDLNVNDTDNNPYNGGSSKTAQDNIEDINKQIAELAQIIIDGQESLQRRITLVDELQVIYDNSLETFKSYLPEDETYDWSSWDAEEELLKARIQAVIDALARASEITNAINSTSKDVIVRAVETILAVCYKNTTSINDIYSSESQYLNDLNNINNQLNDLRNRVLSYSYTDNGQLLLNNITNDLDMVNNYLNELRDSRIPSINDLNNNINSNIVSNWENVQSSINEYFNINDFNMSVRDIYYVNDQIKQHKQFLTTLKNNVKRLNTSIERYESDYQNIVSQETVQNWPDTIEQDGIIYYKDDQGRPDEGYDQRQIDYNGRTYYAWVLNEAWAAAPETIEFDGKTYNKRQGSAPNENYTLLTHDENGITYYAWVYNEEPEPIEPEPIEPEPQTGDLYFSIGSDEITAENYTTVNNAQLVTEYPTETLYNNEIRSYVYVLVSSNKTVQFIEPTLNSVIDSGVVETVNIQDYNVYKSDVKIYGNVKIIVS